MSDAATVEQRVEALERRVLELEAQLLPLAHRILAIEAQLAIQRGMQGNARWSGDSKRMTIEPDITPHAR